MEVKRILQALLFALCWQLVDGSHGCTFIGRESALDCRRDQDVDSIYIPHILSKQIVSVDVSHLHLDPSVVISEDRMLEYFPVLEVLSVYEVKMTIEQCRQFQGWTRVEVAFLDCSGAEYYTEAPRDVLDSSTDGKATTGSPRNTEEIVLTTAAPLKPGMQADDSIEPERQEYAHTSAEFPVTSEAQTTGAVVQTEARVDPALWTDAKSEIMQKDSSESSLDYTDGDLTLTMGKLDDLLILGNDLLSAAAHETARDVCMWVVVLVIVIGSTLFNTGRGQALKRRLTEMIGLGGREADPDQGEPGATTEMSGTTAPGGSTEPSVACAIASTPARSDSDVALRIDGISPIPGVVETPLGAPGMGSVNLGRRLLSFGGASATDGSDYTTV